MSTLTSSLRGVLDPKISDILCGSTTGEVSLDDVALKGQILYMALPKLSNPEVTQHFLRSFQAHLQQVVGHLSETSRSDEVGPPALVILDEFGSYALPGFASVSEMGRSAHLSVWYSIQTRAKLADRGLGLSESFASNIMNNCRTLVAFSILDGDDAKIVSNRWGEKATMDFTLSTTSGESVGTDGPWKMGWSGRQTASQNLNDGHREGKAPEVSPSILTTGLLQLNEGKGRALIDPGTGRPKIVSTGWMKTTIPPDFNPAQEPPQLRPVPANPLALSERIAASIVRARHDAKSKDNTTEEAAGKLTRRPKKVARKRKVAPGDQAAGQPAPTQEPTLGQLAPPMEPAPGQPAPPLDLSPGQPAHPQEPAPPVTGHPAAAGISDTKAPGSKKRGLKVWSVRRNDPTPPPPPNPASALNLAPNLESAPTPPVHDESGEQVNPQKTAPLGGSGAPQEPVAPPPPQEQLNIKLPPPPWAEDNEDGLGAIRWLVGGDA